MENEVLLGNVMVDCKDEKRLQSFYAELLGWERCTLYDRPGVRSTSGTVFLFIEEADYIPPVWPEENGRQQKQMHFDFQVDDVAGRSEKPKRWAPSRLRRSSAGIFL